MAPTGTGNVLVTVSQLYARLRRAGRYSLHIIPNKKRGSPNQREAITFEQLRETTEPVWHSKHSTVIALPAGTFSLAVWLCRPSREKVEYVAEARVLLCELYAERPREFHLMSASGSGSVGVVTLLLQPTLPPRYREEIPLYSGIRRTSSLISSLLSVLEALQSLPKPLMAQYASTVGTGSAYAFATLTFLRWEDPNVPRPARNPIWDLARQLDLQLYHFATRYWPAAPYHPEEASLLASQLIPIAANALSLIFGFMDCYTITGYTFIDEMSPTSGKAFRTLIFQLLVLGAKMRSVYDTKEDLRTLICMTEDHFFSELARQNAKAFIGVSTPTGPRVDFMNCVYGRLAVKLLDAYKAAIDASLHRPQEAGFRSAARRLMTTLAQKTLMLPSALNLDPKHIRFPSIDPTKAAAAKGAMRTTSDKDGGSSAVVSFGTMYSAEQRKNIQVAVKSITKSLDSDKIQETYLEIIAGWTLNHVRLLPTLGIMHHLDMLSLVSQCMSGGNVRSYIDRHTWRGLTARERTTKLNFWLQQVADGVKYMHDEGVTHGDLRGRNILINSTVDPSCSTIVLADFGLSIYVEAASKAHQSSRTGNPRYMAPELQLGQRDTNADDAAGRLVTHMANMSLSPHGTHRNALRPMTTSVGMSHELRARFGGPDFRISPSGRPSKESDLFSFAMLCIELYTGQEPFVASHPDKGDGHIVQLILDGKRPTPLPREIAAQPRLVETIQRCWEQNPKLRGDANRLLSDMCHIAR